MIAYQRNNVAPARPIPAQAGIGLRLPHHRLVRAEAPKAAWLEVHPENYLTPARAEELEAFAADFPISLHAVGLSLGSAHGIDTDHLDRLADLERRIRPGLMSDHLSWSAAQGPGGPLCLPDLLPLPYTEEALAVITANVGHAQDRLGRALLIENPSTYLRFDHSTIEEPAFLAALIAAAGCGALLDVNNIYVSAMNHGQDPAAVLQAYLDQIPAEAIGEIHVAGHALCILDGGVQVRIDDHGSRVSAEVWTLLETAIARIGPRPTLIEWDTQIPPFEVLQQEAAKAQARLKAVAARSLALA